MASAIARSVAAKVPRLAEDLEAAALLGLVRAAASYDPARGVKFATYAAKRVRGEIIDWMRGIGLKGFKRRMGSAPRMGLLSNIAGEGEGARGPLTLGDTIPSGDLPVGWELESADEVLRLTRGLTADEREVLRAYHLRAGATMKRIGGRVGLSESRVSQLIADAVGFLKEMWG